MRPPMYLDLKGPPSRDLHMLQIGGGELSGGDEVEEEESSDQKMETMTEMISVMGMI